MMKTNQSGVQSQQQPMNNSYNNRQNQTLSGNNNNHNQVQSNQRPIISSNYRGKNPNYNRKYSSNYYNNYSSSSSTQPSQQYSTENYNIPSIVKEKDFNHLDELLINKNNSSNQISSSSIGTMNQSNFSSNIRKICLPWTATTRGRVPVP